MSGSAQGAPAAATLTYGRNCQLVIQHPLAPGGRVDVPNIIRFRCRPVFDQVKMLRLDGLALHGDLPREWSGDIEADRGNANLDALMSLIETQWKTAGSYVWGTLTQFVNEANGSVSTYQFLNASFAYENAGEFAGDSLVRQMIRFTAARRVVV